MVNTENNEFTITTDSDYGLTPTGFKPKRLDVILNENNQNTRGVFGESINLEPESPDGQFNGVLSESESNLWQLAQSVYSAFDPEQAQGINQDRLYLLNGIKRKPATFSTGIVSFLGFEGTVIPSDFQVSTALGDVFSTTITGTIGISGSVDIPVVANNSGPVVAEIGQINVIVTPLTGLSTVINNAAISVGVAQESDDIFRARRRISTEFASTNLLDSLFSKLNQLEGVESVFVYENETDVIDGNGLPPHSFNAIILGGDNTEIANTIWTTKPIGILSFGSVSVTITDSQGLPRTISFDRPTPVPIYVVINTNELPDFPSDGVLQIQNAIVNYAKDNILIGQTVYRTRLFDAINSVPGHSVQELFIGFAPAPTGVDDLEVDFNAIATFTVANITVNVS